MTTPLLTTKLLIPPAGYYLVDRPRLLAKLDEGAQRMLTLVCAPAGYGKTTLLSEWISRQSGGSGDQASHRDVPPGRLRFCWVALDDADNDAGRFLSYVQASFEALRAGSGLTSAAVAQSFPLPPVQAILTALINELHQFGAPLVLVLDDYQFITNTAIHECLTFFLDHLPPNVHLVIATRSDPPLAVARLRARGQLVEVRAEDLCFSLEEATQLLNQIVGLKLGAQEVSWLEQRTEGWIAGLQMAALALKSVSQTRPADTAAYIANFSGSNRYILDYLVEEVFSHQPKAIQRFLLETSLLDNLSGPLCDAVTQPHEGETTEVVPSGQQILEYLARANLFLVPLDGERRWYRYHQLFADLLRARLEQQSPQLVSELYWRASRWYESQGLMAGAIAQALAAPDRTYAADLLEREILTFYYHGEITQVHRWLESLPKFLLSQRSLLCAVYAAAMALLPPYPPRTLPVAEEWMQAAEHALCPDCPKGALAHAFIQSIRSYWARFRGEPPEQVTQLIRNALALLPVGPASATDRYQPAIRSALQTNLGLTYWEAGDEAAARQAFSQARQITCACDDLFHESQAVISLARISFLHGQLGEAATLCEEALTFFAGQGAQLGHRVPYSGEIGVQLAEILIEQNELAEAERLLQESLELAKWTMGRHIFVRGHLGLARLAAVRGDSAAAFDHLDEAGKISSEGEELAGAQRATLWVALSGRHPEYMDLARKWGHGHALAEFRPGPPQTDWATSLALACLLLVDGGPLRVGKAAVPRLIEMLEWLERQKRAMQVRGWAHWEIRLSVIECLACQMVGDKAGALAALRQALELAALGGYRQIFVEEGEPMQALLRAYLHSPSSVHQAYVQRLLADLAATDRASPPQAQAGGLAEPFTSRELEILHLLAEGLTNRQIADKLILAEGTVKFYVHGVLEKLGVQNRTQAVAQAKRHNLL